MSQGISFSDVMKEWRKDPEHAAELDRLDAWGKFFELNPRLCPHPCVVAPVDEKTYKELPGVCLYCHADGIMDGGEFPDGPAPTVTFLSTALTITKEFSFGPAR